MKINKPEKPNSENPRVLSKYKRLCALLNQVNKFELKERTRVKVREQLQVVTFLSGSESKMQQLFNLAEVHILEILRIDEGISQPYYYRVRMSVLSALILGSIFGVLLVVFNNALALFGVGLVLGGCPGWVLGATIDYQTKKDNAVLNWNKSYFKPIRLLSRKGIAQQFSSNF
jgi:hypothetical protein